MKVFNTDHLPDFIEYNGNTYVMDLQLSTFLYGTFPPIRTPEINKQKKEAICVSVLSKNLVDKIDERGKPYLPKNYAFSKLPKITVEGREFSVKQFTSVEDTNRWLEANPAWGVIHEQKNPYLIRVARNDDKGTPVKK